MKAREIIARSLEGLGPTLALSITDAILTALREAGYRVLEPGEVDPETIERCAAVCDEINNSCGMEAGLAASCAESIRALKGTDHG